MNGVLYKIDNDMRYQNNIFLLHDVHRDEVCDSRSPSAKQEREGEAQRRRIVARLSVNRYWQFGKTLDVDEKR